MTAALFMYVKLRPLYPPEKKDKIGSKKIRAQGRDQYDESARLQSIE